MSATLTLYIRRDLEQRIRRGEPFGAELTLEGLASQYGVSATPVRRAIDELVADGWLLRQENRRLVVNPDQIGFGDDSSVIEPPPDWDSILQQMVLGESLRGRAVFLREEAIAERFRIGRTLLRRVFSRLSGLGFLEHIPRRGWRVQPFKLADLSSFIDVRAVLELEALQKARTHLQSQQVQLWLVGNQPTVDGRPQSDNRLHEQIVAQCRNRYIKEFFDRHGPYYRTLFEHGQLTAEETQQVAAQHAEILQAMLGNQWDAAANSLRAHIYGQRRLAERLLSEWQSRTDDPLPANSRGNGQPAKHRYPADPAVETAAGG